MIAEITGSYQLFAPAMIAVGLAYVIIGRNTMYQSQVLSPAESPAHRDKYSYPLLNHMHVKEAMKTDVITLSPQSHQYPKPPILYNRKASRVFLSLDNKGNLVGIIANIDVMKIQA